jgi:predicted RNA methylase
MNAQSNTAYGNNTGNVNANTISEIANVLQTQRSWLTTIEESMATLHSRLNPVLQSPLPSPTEKGDKRSGRQSPMGEEIEANNDRIITISQSLADILTRLQL